jgi:hypothetical protein
MRWLGEIEVRLMMSLFYGDAHASANIEAVQNVLSAFEEACVMRWHGTALSAIW